MSVMLSSPPFEEKSSLTPARRQAARRQRRRKNRLRELRDWAITLILAVVLAFVLRQFVVEFITVEGPSMEPTLITNERVLIDKAFYKLFCTPQRGEIVVTRFPEEEDIFIKRIVGLPGERIAIHDGLVYVNGQPLEEEYIPAPINQDMAEVLVPEDHFMVMGDNRNNSHDSRAVSVGPLPRDMLVGRAVAICWPPNSWRGLP